MNVTKLKSQPNKNYLNNYFANDVLHNKKGYDNIIYPSNKEWNNTMYNYNAKYTKHVPILDIISYKLIKGYLNMYSEIMDKKVKLRDIPKNKRTILGSKLWISKPEFKHTNDKIIINLFVYNRKSNFLLLKLNKNINNFYKKKVSFFKNTALNKNKKLFIFIISYYKTKIKSLLKNIENYMKLNNKSNKNLSEGIYIYISKIFYIKLLKRILKKELLVFYYKQNIMFNLLKYKNVFIIPLKKLIGKIYKKKIVFNIINLKTYFLNSDIMTQIISTKAKNRKNKILRILRTAIGKVKTSSFSKNLIAREKKKLEVDNNFLFKNKSELETKYDGVNNVLSNVFRKQKLQNVEYTVLDTIKNKVVTGIRLEASGRLTKRFTAQRSIFKFKYKGTIKNIDTSYRGLSSKNFRNSIESNLQHTNLKSNNRVGAFGIKGWISSI